MFVTGQNIECVLHIKSTEKIFHWTNKSAHPAYSIHETCSFIFKECTEYYFYIIVSVKRVDQKHNQKLTSK